MHDIKNITLAWISSASSIAAAIDEKTLISIISAIILPVVFFTLGKTIDIALQFYFRKREANDKDNKSI
jgi:hypothetical protein